MLGLGSCSLMLAHKQQQHHTDLPSPASLLSQTPERKHLSGETPQGDWSRLEQRRQRRSRWSRWSRWDRGIFHSVLKIMIMGIWFTYNTIKLCKFLFLSFKTVVPPKSKGDFSNLGILRFFWITLYMRDIQTDNFWWPFLMTILYDNSCDLTLDTWDTDYIADNWEQQY